MSRHGFSRPRVDRAIATMMLMGVVLSLAMDSADADKVVTRDGRTIRGAVINESVETPDGPVLVMQTDRQFEPWAIPRSQVRRVIEEPSPLDEYLDRRAAVEDSAEAHDALGRWCKQNRLPRLATPHFQRAVELDPDFAPARQALGQTYFDGRWLDEDQLRSAQGLVQYEGQWVTPERQAQLEARRLRTTEQRLWNKRLGLLVERWRSGSAGAVGEVQDQLRQIDAVEAVPGLARRILEIEDPALRPLFIDALAGIVEPEATDAMVDLFLTISLIGPDLDLILAHLERRDRRRVRLRLSRALGSADQATLGRSAYGLAELDELGVVPKLIKRLVTPQKRIETVPVVERPTFSIGSAFGSDGRPVPFIPMTSVAVTAPGIAVQVPVPLDLSQTRVRMVPRPVTVMVRNEQVLQALQSLTGENFGFDLEAWSTWLRREYRPRPERLRVVPHP